MSQQLLTRSQSGGQFNSLAAFSYRVLEFVHRIFLTNVNRVNGGRCSVFSGAGRFYCFETIASGIIR